MQGAAGVVQSTGYEIAAPGAAYEDFGADAVLLNLETGMYFSVTGSAKAFLAALLQVPDGQAFLNVLGSKDAGLGAMGDSMVQKMLSEGLLRAKAAATGSDLDLDQIASSVTSAGGGFGFDSFSDLADVIAADPIHDFDAATGLPLAANG
jgi:hypothetical protein